MQNKNGAFLVSSFSLVELRQGKKGDESHHLLEARCLAPVDKCRKMESIIYPGLVEGQKMGLCEDDSPSVTHTVKKEKKKRHYPAHPSPIVALPTSLCQSLLSPVTKSHRHVGSSAPSSFLSLAVNPRSQ